MSLPSLAKLRLEPAPAPAPVRRRRRAAPIGVSAADPYAPLGADPPGPRRPEADQETEAALEQALLRQRADAREGVLGELIRVSNMGEMDPPSEAVKWTDSDRSESGAVALATDYQTWLTLVREDGWIIQQAQEEFLHYGLPVYESLIYAAIYTTPDAIGAVDPKYKDIRTVKGRQLLRTAMRDVGDVGDDGGVFGAFAAHPIGIMDAMCGLLPEAPRGLHQRDIYPLATGPLNRAVREGDLVSAPEWADFLLEEQLLVAKFQVAMATAPVIGPGFGTEDQQRAWDTYTLHFGKLEPKPRRYTANWIRVFGWYGYRGSVDEAAFILGWPRSDPDAEPEAEWGAAMPRETSGIVPQLLLLTNFERLVTTLWNTPAEALQGTKDSVGPQKQLHRLNKTVAPTAAPPLLNAMGLTRADYDAIAPVIYLGEAAHILLTYRAVWSGVLDRKQGYFAGPGQENMVVLIVHTLGGDGVVGVLRLLDEFKTAASEAVDGLLAHPAFYTACKEYGSLFDLLVRRLNARGGAASILYQSIVEATQTEDTDGDWRRGKATSRRIGNLPSMRFTGKRREVLINAATARHAPSVEAAVRLLRQLVRESQTTLADRAPWYKRAVNAVSARFLGRTICALPTPGQELAACEGYTQLAATLSRTFSGPSPLHARVRELAEALAETANRPDGPVGLADIEEYEAGDVVDAPLVELGKRDVESIARDEAQAMGEENARKRQRRDARIDAALVDFFGAARVSRLGLCD